MGIGRYLAKEGGEQGELDAPGGLRRAVDMVVDESLGKGGSCGHSKCMSVPAKCPASRRSANASEPNATREGEGVDGICTPREGVKATHLALR